MVAPGINLPENYIIMKREVLADRIVTYCDAIVAFSIVNGLAFLIALGEPDVRCSIGEIRYFMIVANLFFPVLGTAGLIWLRRFELRLRGGEIEEETVARFWRIMHCLRIALIWIFAVLVVTGISGSAFDPNCAG
jgi:hypothetical protein